MRSRLFSDEPHDWLMEFHNGRAVVREYISHGDSKITLIIWYYTTFHASIQRLTWKSVATENMDKLLLSLQSVV